MKREWKLGVAIGVIAALVMTQVILADDISNNLDTSIDAVAEVMSLNVGGADGTTQLYVTPRNGDGKSGCNLTGSTTLVVSVSSSDTSVATVSPSSVTFTSCGDTPTLTVTPHDAGSATISLSQTSNTTAGTFDLAPATFRVDVTAPPPSDTTAPEISYVLNPASPDGDNGWYKSDVTLTWTVTENESPSSLVKTGCVDQNITADQLETTYSCSATSDGGSAGPVEVKIKRDATPPEVSLVDGPADGASYYFGSVPAAPTCNASDATSGLDGSCSVSGYDTAVGTHTVEAKAKDLAGNEASDSAAYTVLAWTLNGFYQPVDMGGVWNTVKNGSTVPLKFEVFAGSTELTDTAIVSTLTKQVTCNGGSEDTIEVTATGGTSLRYDFTTGQFVFNWQTPRLAGKCYEVTMTTQDGSSLVAFFKLK